MQQNNHLKELCVAIDKNIYDYIDHLGVNVKVYIQNSLSET